MSSYPPSSGFRGHALPPRVLDRAALADFAAAHRQSGVSDRRPRRQSIARRVKKRLIVGTAALALFGLWVWITPDESPGTTSSTEPSPVRGIAVQDVRQRGHSV